MGYKKNRLPPREYHDLCQSVFEKYKWKCHLCKNRNNLHAHHIVFRSKGGRDIIENLVCLCHSCHTKVHLGKLPNNFN